jgi:adenosylhomocysteinase
LKVENNPDHAKAAAFFRRILSSAVDEDLKHVRVLAVVHVVDSSIAFIPALDERFTLQAYLGKPSSIQPDASSYLSAAVADKEFELDKASIRERPEAVLSEVFPRIETALAPPVVILDIGGYFAPGPNAPAADPFKSIKAVLADQGYHLVGIVEDTENGHKRYQNALERVPKGAADSGVKVYSVARSPLKKPENHLVGVAVTFSIEAILRQSNVVLQSRRAGVIGFGPIGRSVAHAMRGRGIPVSICEIDSIKLAQAAAQGFRVFDYAMQFEEFCTHTNLLISATGAGADSVNGHRPINDKTVGLIGAGTFVASVTSQDDEIDLESIVAAGYKGTKVRYNEDLTKWSLSAGEIDSISHSFYLMLDGNAVNFKHQGVIGPAIQLLQGEIAACIIKLVDTAGEPAANSVLELNKEEQTAVADAWLDQYLV